MENNITKILIKNSGKGVTLPLNSWIFGASLPATQKVSVPISFRTHIPIGWSFTTLLLSRIKNLLFVVNKANSNRISLNNRKYAENSS